MTESSASSTTKIRNSIIGLAEAFWDAKEDGSSSSAKHIRRRSSRALEASGKLLRRTSSAVWQERPRTVEGWAVLLAAVASAVVGYELQVQQSLTCPPFVFVQQHDQDVNVDDNKKNQTHDETMQRIYQLLTQNNGILGQAIQPSLWVGTRSSLSSGLALIAGIPRTSHDHIRFRERVTMPYDGAVLALDWEAPLLSQGDGNDDKINLHQRLLKGPIDKPVILILHGINNDSNAGYIRSLQRILTNRGHIAVGMNFRGCGGIELATPRSYNGAYTGDLRSVVHMIEGRLAPHTPLLLVGHSLGANLVTKYLGEEGLSGSLPACVAGGASLGNPLEIHSKNNMHTPWKQLIAWGVKMDLAKHWRNMKHYSAMYPEVRQAMWKTLKASSIHEVDEAFLPILLRNDPYYPFAPRIGFKDGEDYWRDASSYRFMKHISVPLLQIIAGDDKVVYHSFQRKLTHSILNPNIMSVETKCGGHLGWQESPPSDSASWLQAGPSWAGRATADFIDAVLKTRQTMKPKPAVLGQIASSTEKDHMNCWERPPNDICINCDKRPIPVLRSRL